MLVPDRIYKRIPLLWMFLGILFLILGARVGRDYSLFPFYIGAGFLCIGRSLWIYQARWKFFLKNDVKAMYSTQVAEKSEHEKPFQRR